RLFFVPSSCVSCKTRISPLYLIPILGWFFAKGRCSHCGSSIRISHLYIESAFGLLSVLFLFLTKNAPLTLILLFFCGHLLVAMITDWYRQLLDYENTAVLFVFSILYVYVSGGDFLYHLYSFGGVAAFFLISFLLTKGRQPGFGDILLAAVLGLAHGFPWILVPLQIGASGSILHLWIVKRNFRSSAPLGFYLSLGSILTFFISSIIELS
ncbi:MAG: prepilin peptidase, partial [Leptonema sp. (in: Bacteria)]|nr:prepilin peptidase [Leptonema sp. (in: bacteria)]